MDQNKTLAARNSRLRSQKRNALKVARRASGGYKPYKKDNKKLLEKLNLLTLQFDKQQATYIDDTRQYKSRIEFYKQLKTKWKKRAYAAEKSRRRMLARKSKRIQTAPFFNTKSSGAYDHRIRSLSRKLNMSGVSAVQIPKIIRKCALAFGINIGHVPSARSVGRFVLEGGVGAKIQAGDVLAKAQGITTSMDSTSHRNINFSSMHLMANTGDVHKQLYLAVESTTDHTSETQVNTLKRSIEAICDTSKRAASCSGSLDVLLSVSDVARKLCGANGDHANDQLKVAQLEQKWKLDSWIDYLGNLALSNLGDSEAEMVYQELRINSELAAGGSDVFNSLSTANQESLCATEYQKYIAQIGRKEFDQSPPDVQLDRSRIIRGGCCAHKDMNAAKGGASGMLAYWKTNTSLTPPVILFNKDNNAAVLLSKASTDISPAEQRALSVSESGAIKLCSLAGAVFNHKDDKKGHQDSHTYWFQAYHCRFHRFPDTSNVRYSSYIDASTELCTLQGAYIDYLEHCRQRKLSGTLNHMECNVLKALNCPATLAELLVISLYGQIVSIPYMRLVRSATVAGKGLADLAELHAQVQHHLESIILQPELVLGQNALAVTATLDGSEWENSEVVLALRQHESNLPYLTDLFVAFCRGASKTWARFTEEFAADGPLSQLNNEQRNLAFMPPTNDANEGALGTWRVWTRRFPCLALHRYNALMANRTNNTEAYMEANFTDAQYKWARAEARRIDSSKIEETRKRELVLAAEQEAEKNQAAQDKRADRRAQKQQYISGVKHELDREVIIQMKGAQLDDQLKVYRQILVNQPGFPRTGRLKVAEKRNLVLEMASRYVQAISILQKSS